MTIRDKKKIKITTVRGTASVQEDQRRYSGMIDGVVDFRRFPSKYYDIIFRDINGRSPTTWDDSYKTQDKRGKKPWSHG